VQLHQPQAAGRQRLEDGGRLDAAVQAVALRGTGRDGVEAEQAARSATSASTCSALSARPRRRLRSVEVAKASVRSVARSSSVPKPRRWRRSSR
jgi:hypothetical protein